MRPLKPGQGYMVAVTNSVTDNQGRGIKGSSSWELVAKDIAQYPLPLASQTLLQTIVNQMLDLMGTKGVDADSVVYSKYMSVQSVGAVMGTIKQLQIAPFATAVGGGMPIAQAAQYLPAIVAGDYKVGETVVPDLLALTQPGLSCDAIVAGVLAGDATATATFPAVAGACATDLKMGSITLPYYLSSTNPLGDYWKGACTNGVMLQLLGGEQIGGLVANGAVGPNNATCQAAGLFDLNLAAVGIDDPRNLTKFAPIPAKDSDQTLDVQITVPDATVVSMIAGAPVQMPEAGWPVVMLTHGITSKKEDMLAVAAAFAAQGYATVAIDQPLHGSRGFLIGEQIVNASTGFGGSATDYMNLSSLLSARDNVRQSSLDSLGLRLGLNALVDTTGGSIKLDTNNVHFFGHSIGAITGTNTVGVANTSLGGALANFDGMYNIKSAVLANPGGSIAAFLTESRSFGGLVNSTVASGVSPEFATFYAGFDAAGYIGSRVGQLMAVDTTLTAEAAQAQAAAEIPTVVFETFMMRGSAEGIAQVRAGIASFVFAATTILDSADPLNTAGQLAASGTPVYVNLVTGDGSDENVQDTTIPANLSNPAYLLSGGEPLAAIAMGLPQVTTTQPGSGYVAFSQGTHSSVAAPGTPINAEMLAQVISFIATASTGAENATVVVGGSEFIDQRTFAERRMEAQGQ
jgi:Pla-1/cef family extracellular lipase